MNEQELARKRDELRREMFATTQLQNAVIDLYAASQRLQDAGLPEMAESAERLGEAAENAARRRAHTGAH